MRTFVDMGCTNTFKQVNSWSGVNSLKTINKREIVFKGTNTVELTVCGVQVKLVDDISIVMDMDMIKAQGSIICCKCTTKEQEP